MVIDFEWAGKSGLVKYPANINPDADWSPGVAAGRTILSPHDVYQLEKL